MTMGMLGGMIGPSVAEAAETAQEKGLSNPALSIAWTSMTPGPATSAISEPDIPAKIMELTMFTCARPPRALPTTALAKSKSLSVSLEVLNTFAEKMKSGTARSTKLFSNWITITSTTFVRSTLPRMKYSTELTIIAKPYGAPMRNMTKNTASQIATATGAPPRP